MEERRRNVRTDLEGELVIKRLDDRTGDKVLIRVNDVSKTGIGFQCDEDLEMGSVYECFLTLWTKEVMRTFIEIVRAVKKGEENQYGGIFIGMTEMDAYRIQVYQTVEEYKQ